jgi:hypothetical protein
VALIGVTEVGGKSQAWLVDLTTRRRETVSPGQEAFGYRVRKVDPERVTLTRGGQQWVVRLGEKQVPVASAPRPVALPDVPVAEPRVAREVDTGAPEYVFSAELEELLAEPRAPVTTGGTTDARRTAAGDPLPYPGHGYQPGYDVLPEFGAGYGLPPGYGFDPRYPAAVDPYTGYPTYPGLYPGMAPELSGYPDYLGQPYPGQLYPTWPPPYGMSGVPITTGPDFLGNVSGPRAPRWNSQTSRRRSTYFGGSTPSNPQTQRRRQTFEPR